MHKRGEWNCSAARAFMSKSLSLPSCAVIFMPIITTVTVRTSHCHLTALPLSLKSQRTSSICPFLYSCPSCHWPILKAEFDMADASKCFMFISCGQTCSSFPPRYFTAEQCARAICKCKGLLRVQRQTERVCVLLTGRQTARWVGPLSFHPSLPQNYYIKNFLF